ncbi:MAG: extracellular solute-binding protein [Armatimonadetes bacterium]|nr:extracellular solute-binding protein [Armatimonadota bacterium]NIM23003.1 extracellular solute-binding protein [Armatimonadota bacterium]NIM66874.1 extracellular solute-binding protein [Armatimonadota bacterium]NIM75414.1 extracellular solute-binding protein [Armatimonadota bacterium]NIN05061.1 extracellular solute-binding protein [Armatimonadota bacterium]
MERRGLLRWLVLLCCLSLMLAILPGCGKKAVKKPGKDEKTEVVFWHSYVAATTPALERLIQRFEAAHPNITIKAQYVQTGEGLLQKLAASVMSETAPDLCWIHASWVGPLSREELIYDLGELIEKYGGFGEEEKADFFPAPLETSYYRGKLRMMPIEATNLGLAYNRELYRKAGLDPNDPPENWDEFVEYGKKLTIRSKDRVEQWACNVPVFTGSMAGWSTWQWVTFLWGWGGRYAHPSGERVDFNSAAAVGALQFWVDLQHKYKIGSLAPPEQGFESQKVAMTFEGPWSLPRFEDLAFDWAVAPMPAGPKRRVTSLGAEYLVVFRQTKHPKEAWEFIRWFITPEVQEAWSIDSKYLPIRQSVLASPTYRTFLDKNPAMKTFAEQMPYAYAEPSILPDASEVDLFLATAIEEAVRKVKTPKQALDDAAEKANIALAEAKAREEAGNTQ